MRDDNKLLHIVERFSLLENLVARASFGRIIADLLSFCSSERGQAMIVEPNDGYVFGYLQYRVFAYSICLLVQVETLLKGQTAGAKSQTCGASALNSSFANSLRTFTLLMKGNLKAVNVVKKLFKDFLFKKVPTNLDQRSSWGECEWYNFFIVVRNERDDGPKNYWSDQSQ